MPREDYDAFPKTDANYVPLSPLSFIRRAAEVHGDHTAVIHGSIQKRGARRIGVVCNSAMRCQNWGSDATIRSVFSAPTHRR